MPSHDFRAPRLFVDAALAQDARVPLDRDQSNYLGNVLRLAAGAEVLAFNGRDGEWQAAIEGRKRDRKSTRLNSSHIQKSRMPSSA